MKRLPKKAAKVACKHMVIVELDCHCHGICKDCGAQVGIERVLHSRYAQAWERMLNDPEMWPT